jgi:hypothetical protein
MAPWYSWLRLGLSVLNAVARVDDRRKRPRPRKRPATEADLLNRSTNSMSEGDPNDNTAEKESRQ